jgi:hypothetical protein
MVQISNCSFEDSMSAATAIGVACANTPLQQH